MERCEIVLQNIEKCIQKNGKLWEKVFLTKTAPYMDGKTRFECIEEVKRDAKEALLLAESFDIENLMAFEPFIKEIHDGCKDVQDLL